jgi:hypothetical protein
MQAQNPKGKLMQHGFQHGQQELLVDPFHTTHHLPLRDGIHGIDVIHPLGAFPVALVHRVDAHEPGRPCGSGLRRSPMAIAVGCVGFHSAAILR